MAPTPIDGVLNTIFSVAGDIIGFAYGFASTGIEALLSNDQTKIFGLLAQLLVIYLALTIIRRTAGLVFSTFIFFLKLAVVSALLLGGIYAANNGVAKTAEDLLSWVNTQATGLASDWPSHGGYLAQKWATNAARSYATDAQAWAKQAFH